MASQNDSTMKEKENSSKKEENSSKKEEDMYILNSCQQMMDELNATKGTNSKIEILKTKYVHLLPLIKRIWNESTKTNVTLKGINDFEKKDSNKSGKDFTLYDLFDALTSRAITGDTAKASIWNFIKKYPTHKDLIKKIMEKNLRMRLGEKLIEQAFPGTFVQFDVALASEYDENKFLAALKEYSALNVPAFISKKIDGVRVITKIVNGDIKFYSRVGNEFTSLSNLRKAISHLLINSKVDTSKGIVIDGEVIVVDTDGNENFKLTVSSIKQKTAQIKHPIYRVFDLLPLSVFEGKEVGPILSDRFQKLSEFISDNKSPEIQMLQQTPYTAKAFDELKEQAKKEKWEGLMIRFNRTYEGKRSKYLLKYKFFETEEFKVEKIGIEIMPFPNKSGGEDFKRAMRNAEILYKGDPVSVGSGFTTEERLQFAEKPDLIVGKLISVRYQEPFRDKETGKWSLRVPTFQGIIGDKRDF